MRYKIKLASFRVGQKETYGLKVEKGIVDLGKKLGARYPNLRALIEDEEIAEARCFLQAKPDYQEDNVVFLPVINNPRKIFCVGMNYAEKRAEFGEMNSAPTLFICFPDSQVGHNCDVEKPAQSNEFNYEEELPVIIGKRGKEISASNAFSYIAGYSCYMDGSVRDWQHTSFTAGKN